MYRNCKSQAFQRIFDKILRFSSDLKKVEKKSFFHFFQKIVSKSVKNVVTECEVVRYQKGRNGEIEPLFFEKKKREEKHTLIGTNYYNLLYREKTSVFWRLDLATSNFC